MGDSENKDPTLNVSTEQLIVYERLLVRRSVRCDLGVDEARRARLDMRRRVHNGSLSRYFL